MRFNEAFKNMSSHFQHPAVVHSALFFESFIKSHTNTIYVSRFQGNVSTYFTPNLFIAYAGGIQCLRRQEKVGSWSKKDQILST